MSALWRGRVCVDLIWLETSRLTIPPTGDAWFCVQAGLRDRKENERPSFCGMAAIGAEQPWFKVRVSGRGRVQERFSHNQGRKEAS